MPTPRQHGGAAIQHIPLTVPGFNGLNLQAQTSLLGKEWATILVNSVIDDSSRVAARKGWTSVTTATPASAQISQLFEYRKYDGTTELLAGMTDTDIERSTDNGDTWADVTGTATHASASIQFLNFADSVIGVTDDGEDPIIYAGTSFADLTDTGSEPHGSVGLAAFGRLWITDTNNTVVKYCALLDETDWSGTDAGNIDMRNVWPDGDNITALAAFNGALIIFGNNNIAIYADGQGSALGVDPTQLYLVDTITGTGCIARDTVQNVDGDLWFLSSTGVQSLGRLIQEKSNPLQNLSIHVQDYVATQVAQTVAADIRAIYSPEDRFYLLSLPRTTSGAESGVALCFDTRGRLQDGAARCSGVWSWLVPRAPLVRADKTFLSAVLNVVGEVGSYSGNNDDTTLPYTFEYLSGWMDLTQQGFLIMPKRVTGLFFSSNETDVTFAWGWDFQAALFERTKTITPTGGLAEYGEAEWSIGEFGESTTLTEGKVAGAGTGEFIRLGINATIDDGDFSIQQLDLLAKIGRIK